MGDSCYDLSGTPVELLRVDLDRLKRDRDRLSVQDGPSARRYKDMCEDIRELEDELDRRITA